MDKTQYHVDKHVDLALEVLTLISGSLDATDEGVAHHLAELAAARSRLLLARLEAERQEVYRTRAPEEIARFAEVLDNVIPITEAHAGLDCPQKRNRISEAFRSGYAADAAAATNES